MSLNPTTSASTAPPSAVLMLQHLKEDQKANAIVEALKTVLASGHVTPDLGGTATTTSFADAICAELH